MKINLLAIFIVLAMLPIISKAQWTSGSGMLYTTDNVGIGTTSPVNKLTVFGASGTTQNNIASFSNSTNGAYTALTASGSASSVLTWPNGSQIMEFVPFSAGNGIVSSFTGSLVFQTNNRTNQMIINPNGNVGIGTTAPNEKLVVTGNIKAVLEPAFPTKNNVRITSLGFSGPTGAVNWAIRGVYQHGGGVNLNADGGDLDIIKSLDGNTILGTKTDGTPLGNVGIGITYPQNKLDVNGTIHSKAVKIDLNGWGDYVFKKDYRLRSLAEVKDYIDQKQHLPEVPSEQEMIKNGLNVAEMNKLLIKKVEELTLYLIDMKAEIKDLQKQIKNTKKI